MVHFGAVVSHEIEAEHPSAIHRLGFVKGKNVKPVVLIYIQICYVFLFVWFCHRWIRDCFKSLSAISLALAEHGPGKLPLEKVRLIEHEYMTYRDRYNRPWDRIWWKIWVLHVLFSFSPQVWFLFSWKSFMPFSSIFSIVWFSPRPSHQRFGLWGTQISC